MSNNVFAWDMFYRVPIIGIIRNVSMEEVTQILPMYYEAGLTTIEITMNTNYAGEIIRWARSEFDSKLNVGAGTVCTKKDLNSAMKAGAQFIVTPIVKRKIIQSCVKQEVPIFSGAFSPTEIYKAWYWGAAMVKVFPAATLGPTYIKDVKAPLNKIKLVPTGGINLENLVSFKKAGADAFGIGSPLFNKKFIREKDWGALKDHFKKFADLVMVDP